MMIVLNRIKVSNKFPMLGLMVRIMRSCLTIMGLLFANMVYGQNGEEPFTNRLINSQNPYLIQHAHNPVDWYPWGEEALEKARRENKPIFVSVGYSTCYWCQVAEREIFSNADIAKLMNQWFVNVKIDREERPDLDRIYMLATQIITGRGGWPNNVFLTPHQKPFFAGSYFPPADKDGRPGFPKILKALHAAWDNDQDRVEAMAEEVYRAMRQYEEEGSTNPITIKQIQNPGQWLNQAVINSKARFDPRYSGFGGDSTKFPDSPQLFLLSTAPQQEQSGDSLQMFEKTLTAMAIGGIMDQLAGGFHRYSTEPSWSVPHFEKMLYDNAQLLGLYAKAYAITKNPFYRQITMRTASYLITEMEVPGGGFYSAQDATVSGVEGASYVWTRGQIESILGGSGAEAFFALYELIPIPEAPSAAFDHPTGGVLRLKGKEAGELQNTGQLDSTVDRLVLLRKKLLNERQVREQPLRDEKVITADNALAIIGFSDAGQFLNDPKLTGVAERTADRIWQLAYEPESGELKHQFFEGKSGGTGFLDDYALLGHAFMRLYHHSNDNKWLRRAQLLTDSMLKRFLKPNGRLASSWDAGNLLMATPVQGDSVKPCGQSAAIVLLLEMASATNEQTYARTACQVLSPLIPRIDNDPSGWGLLVGWMNEPNLFSVFEDSINSIADDDQKADQKHTFPDSADHVTVSGVWEYSEKTMDLLVTVNIEKGYHINANPASDSNLIATQLLIEGHSQIKVNYPASKIFKATFAPEGIAVYEGSVTLQASLPGSKGSSLPNVSLLVQVCNHEVCFAPATIPVTVSIP